MSSIDKESTIHESIARLQRLSDLFAARRQQLARKVGLTEREWQVLEEISSEHFMPSMFARQSEQTPAAVSKVLRQLLGKGLVRSSVADGDGRKRAYELTPTGEAVMRRLRSERNHAIEAIWRDLPAQQLRAFSALSGELIARIEAYAEREGR